MRDLLDKLDPKERWQLMAFVMGVAGLAAVFAFGWRRSAGSDEQSPRGKPAPLIAQGPHQEVIDLRGDPAAQESTSSEEAMSEPPGEIRVHVSGAVKSPGVYAMKPGQRIQDAIDAAGGVVKGAALDALNLAERVQDAQKIHVPKQGETAALAPLTIDQPIPPLPAGSLEVSPSPSPPRFTPPTAIGAGSSSTQRPTRGSREVDSLSPGLIDINRASATELERLPGVGPAIAQRIIQYRAQNGPFRSVDDLILVKGIGPKRMADIRPYIRVR